MASLIGLIGAARAFGLPLLAGSSPFFTNPNGDSAQWLTAWHFFAREPWRLPLLYAPSLQPPEGMSLAYLDPTPWFACLAKLVAPLFGPDWTPYGAWCICSFALQAISAALLLRQCGYRGGAHALAAAIIATTAHPFLHRWAKQHASLTGHFLVLLALALYLRYRGRSLTWRESGIWLALLALAVATHPYLFVMCAPIAGAAFLRSSGGSLRGAPTLLLRCLAVTAVAAGTMWVVGYFPLPHYSQGVDGYFGPAAMNLLAPFIPSTSTFLPWLSFSAFDATGEQYDGNFYPGLGVAVLLVVLLVRRRNLVWAGIRRHWPLVCGFALLTLLAVTPRIYVGHVLLWSMPLPEWAGETLSSVRVTERMFLPVSYGVIAAVLVWTLRSLSPRTGAVVLVGVAGVQLVDFDADWTAVRVSYAAPAPGTLDRAAWEPVVSNHARMEIYPSYQCLPNSDLHGFSRQLHLLAARHGVGLNGVYGARLMKHCTSEAQAFAKLADHVIDDTLYVFLKPRDRLNDILSFPLRDCVAFEQGIACSHRMRQPALQSAKARFTPIGHELPFMKFGAALTFGEGRPGNGHLMTGWSWPEPGHIWTTSGEASLVLRVPATDKPLRLDMIMVASLDDQVNTMNVDLLANETPVARWTFTPADNNVSPPRQAVLPPSVIADGGLLQLKIRVDHPHQRPTGDDRRLLGVALAEVSINQ